MANPWPQDKPYYSHLTSHRNKRMGLNLSFVVCYILTTIVLFKELVLNEAWHRNLLPLLLFNIPVIIFPMVQEWNYRPWQSKPQKYERHHTD